MVNFGQIHVQFDKDSYAPGDQVNGFIYLNLFTNYPSNTVYLMIAGVEETRLAEARWMTHSEYNRKWRYHGRNYNYWGYSRYRKRYRAHFDNWHNISHHDRRRVGGEDGEEERKVILDHYQHKPVFNHKFPVYQFGGAFIPAGQYSFPVSFVLPQGMPASFNHEWDEHDRQCFADISYTMVASLDFAIASFSFGKVSNTQTFTVNQAIKGDGQMKATQINQKVTHCCCMGKGEVHIKAYFERSDYQSGENAAIIAEIDNSNCTAEIKEIDGVFRQYLTITAGSYTKTIKNQLTKTKLTGIAPGQKNVGEQARRMEVNLTDKSGGYVQPSANGNLIKNKYALETITKMDAIQCCQDAPKASIEANIFNRAIERTVWTQPPGWSPQVMNAYTCNFNSQFAINGALTASNAIFGGAPNVNIQIGGQQGNPGMPPHPGQPPNPGQPPHPGQPPNPGNSGMHMNVQMGGMNMQMNSNFSGNGQPPAPGFQKPQFGRKGKW